VRPCGSALLEALNAPKAVGQKKKKRATDRVPVARFLFALNAA